MHLIYEERCKMIDVTKAATDYLSKHFKTQGVDIDSTHVALYMSAG